MAQIVKLIIIALLTLVGMEQAEARSTAAVTAVSSLPQCVMSETTCANAPTAGLPATADARQANPLLCAALDFKAKPFMSWTAIKGHLGALRLPSNAKAYNAAFEIRPG